MRVGIDISQSVYEGTGSGRYVVELVNELLRNDSANEYILFGSAMRRMSDLKSRKYNTKTSFFPFPPKFFEFVWNKWHVLPFEMFTGKVDVYHSSDWSQAPSRAKKVTTIHDVMPFLFPTRFHPRIVEAHRERWKWIEKEVDNIIVDAQSTKVDVCSLFKIDPSRVVVIPLGCDERFFNAKKNLEKIAQVQKKYQLEKYILAVGTLEPRKNMARLVEAFGKIDRELQQDYKLVIVGKKAWAEALGQQENMLLTGYVEDADLPYLYAGAKCFVMPSLYEGFGLPVLEAMAAGVPVICSHKSSLPEIGGDDVHYIEDAESVDSIRIVLEHVLTSEEYELAEVAESAYNRAKQFTWERTAKETLEVYKKLCA
jgi:glycosyltransferase involved in cell wall biosynthesis